MKVSLNVKSFNGKKDIRMLFFWNFNKSFRFVKPGQTVAEFDKICEVQSDKASVEISSRYAGNITKIHYDVNQVAKVGSALVDIETEEEEEDDNEEVVNTATDATAPAVVPVVGSSSYISLWETPAVRRLLHEYGLNVKDLSGSGKNGRVLKGDVLSLIKSNSLEKKGTTNKKIVEELIIILTFLSIIKKVYEMKEHVIKTMEADVDGAVPLTAIQKAMFKTMTKSLAIPQLGFKDEIDLNSTSEYKNALNAYIAGNPDLYEFKKISYLPIFIKCLSLSLSFFPIMNAQITENAGVPQINYRPVHNIGVAMDTPQGLIVPNIKNVQQKTIFEIASEVHRLTQLAKRGAIPLSDLKGGTITLSNIGSIGGTYANPIIVSNESAIVALGSARKLPRFAEGSNTMVAKQIMPVSWSADHRVVDGATMAQFSNTWKSFIENPALLASKLH